MHAPMADNVVALTPAGLTWRDLAIVIFACYGFTNMPYYDTLWIYVIFNEKSDWLDYEVEPLVSFVKLMIVGVFFTQALLTAYLKPYPFRLVTCGAAGAAVVPLLYSIFPIPGSGAGPTPSSTPNLPYSYVKYYILWWLQWVVVIFSGWCALSKDLGIGRVLRACTPSLWVLFTILPSHFNRYPLINSLAFGTTLLVVCFLPNGASPSDSELHRRSDLHNVGLLNCIAARNCYRFSQSWRGKHMQVVASSFFSLFVVMLRLFTTPVASADASVAFALASASCAVMLCSLYSLMADVGSIRSYLAIDSYFRSASLGKGIIFSLKALLIHSHFVKWSCCDESRARASCEQGGGVWYLANGGPDGTCVLGITWKRFGEVFSIFLAAMLDLGTLAAVAVGDARSAMAGNLRVSTRFAPVVAPTYGILVISVFASSASLIIYALTSPSINMTGILVWSTSCDVITKCCLNEGARHFDACRPCPRYAAIPRIRDFRFHLTATLICNTTVLVLFFGASFYSKPQPLDSLSDSLLGSLLPCGFATNLGMPRTYQGMILRDGQPLLILIPLDRVALICQGSLKAIVALSCAVLLFGTQPPTAGVDEISDDSSIL